MTHLGALRPPCPAGCPANPQTTCAPGAGSHDETSGTFLERFPSERRNKQQLSPCADAREVGSPRTQPQGPWPARGAPPRTPPSHTHTPGDRGSCLHPRGLASTQFFPGRKCCPLSLSSPPPPREQTCRAHTVRPGRCRPHPPPASVEASSPRRPPGPRTAPPHESLLHSALGIPVPLLTLGAV